VTELRDGYHLLDQGPRTFGSMTASAGPKAGELVIDAKYVVAYAFDNPRPEGLTGPGDIVSFVRVDDRYVIRQGKNFATSSYGLWPASGGGSFYEAIGCDALQAGLPRPRVQQSERHGPARRHPGSARRVRPEPAPSPGRHLLRPVTHRVPRRGTFMALNAVKVPLTDIGHTQKHRLD